MSEHSAENDAGEKSSPEVSQIALDRTVPSDGGTERGETNGDTEQRWGSQGDHEQRDSSNELGSQAPVPEVRTQVSTALGERRNHVRARLSVARLRVRADHHSLGRLLCAVGIHDRTGLPSRSARRSMPWGWRAWCGRPGCLKTWASTRVLPPEVGQP